MWGASASVRLVASDDDPARSVAEARALAERLDVDWDLIPGAGRIAAESGYGRWPAALAWASTGATPVIPR